MVIRFQKPSKPGTLPLFENLEPVDALHPDPPNEAPVLALDRGGGWPMLSVRQIEHRKKMLEHLTELRKAQ
jgi:hypothetical protein